MIKINVEEIWEEARRLGAITPKVEARLARQRAKGIESLLGDLEHRDYFQMKWSVEYMTDEQVSRLVDQLSLIRVVGLLSYLNPAQTERVVSAIKSEKHRLLVEQILKYDNENYPRSKEITPVKASER